MPTKKSTSKNALITVEKPSTDFSAERKAIEPFTSLRVTSDARLVEARSALSTVKAFLRKVNDTFDPIIKAINAAAKEARTQKLDAAAPFENAKISLETSIKSYLDKKELEAQAKIEAEREALASAAPDEDVSKSLKKISRLEESSSSRSASTYKRYYASVDSIELLLKAVLSGTVSYDAIIPNMVYLNKLASTEKENLSIPGVSILTNTVLVG